MILFSLLTGFESGMKLKWQTIPISSGKFVLDVELNPSAVILDEVLVQDEKVKEKNISVINVPTKLLSLLPSISSCSNTSLSLGKATSTTAFSLPLSPGNSSSPSLLS